MAKTAVYSLRIPYVVIAQCYDLLEASGVAVENLKPSTAVRTALEAICGQLQKANRVPPYTDAAALKRVTDLAATADPSDLTSDLDALFQPSTPTPPSQAPRENPTTNSAVDPVVADPDVRAEARARIHAVLEPKIAAARLAEEEERFAPVGEYNAELPREAPVAQQVLTAPWENAQVASTNEFAAAAEVSNFCAMVVAQESQLGALAARMVLPNLSSDMLGTGAAERLFHKTYDHLENYVNIAGDIQIPATFPEGSLDGVTAPPEANDPE